MNVTNLSFIGQDFLLHNYSCKAIRQWGSQTVFGPSFLSIRCLYSLSFRSFSPLVFNVVHITQSSVFCILVRGLLTIVCFFVLFLLAIVQSVCYTASKYVFGIFKRLCKDVCNTIAIFRYRHDLHQCCISANNREYCEIIFWLLSTASKD